MKLTHRIVELDNGFFTVERYTPWFFFGIEIPEWKGYGEWVRDDYGDGFGFREWKGLKFNTQDNALRWMRDRYGDDNVKIENIRAIVGAK